MSEWIKCSDRLPEDCKNVIVAGGIAHYSYAASSWFTITYTEVSKKIHWPVTYWMPLPEPPKE